VEKENKQKVDWERKGLRIGFFVYVEKEKW